MVRKERARGDGNGISELVEFLYGEVFFFQGVCVEGA